MAAEVMTGRESTACMVPIRRPAMAQSFLRYSMPVNMKRCKKYTYETNFHFDLPWWKANVRLSAVRTEGAYLQLSGGRCAAAEIDLFYNQAAVVCGVENRIFKVEGCSNKAIVSQCRGSIGFVEPLILE